MSDEIASASPRNDVKIETAMTDILRRNFMEVTITTNNFDDEVLKSDKPVLVDFWATWCGPCKMMGPEIAKIADERASTLKVGKVNVDDEPELAQKFGIMSIPTVILFNRGKAEKTSVGFLPKDELLKNLGL